jgi:hypothetical protein
MTTKKTTKTTSKTFSSASIQKQVIKLADAAKTVMKRMGEVAQNASTLAQDYKKFYEVKATKKASPKTKKQAPKAQKKPEKKTHSRRAS